MTHLGDFNVLEQLGQSSSADRYKAMHTSQGGPFFVKIYARLDVRAQPDLLARSEALIGQRHPNLARHLGHGVIDGAPFVVSPYLEGLDLSAVLTHVITTRTVFPVQRALMIVVDVLAGLAALHQFGRAADGSALLTHGAVAVR